MTKKEFQNFKQEMDNNNYICNVCVFSDKEWKYPSNYRYYSQGEIIIEDNQVRIKKSLLYLEKIFEELD